MARLFVVMTVLAALVGSTGAVAGAGSGTGHARCGASTPGSSQAAPASAVAVAIDGSRSTSAVQLRREYRQAALSAVQLAAADEAAVRLVVFGASGVGAQVIFSGSFVPVSTVYAFNLAARNHLLCLAKRALASAFVGRTRLAGTDVAGATAEQVAWGRSVVRRRGGVSVLVLSDGCQAPSPSGPNSGLTDLCGALGAGRKPARILAHHRSEFSLGNARGVHVTMEGIGVSKKTSDASTRRAEELVRFWRLACRRAGAGCKVRSAVL